jgi:hypothetical protein
MALAEGRVAAPNRRAMLACLAGVAWPVLASAAPADASTPRIEWLTVGASRLELQFGGDFDAATVEHARTWVQRSAAAVAAYFGRFPVGTCEVLLVPVDGAGVRGGTAYAEPTLLVRLRVGRATTAAQFADDWVLVHEMVHLAVPRVPRAQNWLHEGIATYVEPLARAHAGLVAPATVWHGWAREMAQGQPRAGDAGLDHTPTWARTYWGGAMFCLLADVRLLQRSAGRVGLQQALRGVLAAGGSYAVQWPAAKVLATADSAVGERALSELYAQMKDAPAPADLDGLWRQLGVRDGTLDDGAPLAAVRRAILS